MNKNHVHLVIWLDKRYKVFSFNTVMMFKFLSVLYCAVIFKL